MISGVYKADLNNQLDQYTGNWLYEDGSEYINFELIKLVNTPFGSGNRDLIVGQIATGAGSLAAGTELFSTGSIVPISPGNPLSEDYTITAINLLSNPKRRLATRASCAGCTWDGTQLSGYLEIAREVEDGWTHRDNVMFYMVTFTENGVDKAAIWIKRNYINLPTSWHVDSGIYVFERQP